MTTKREDAKTARNDAREPEFGARLRKLRLEAGFPTAYKFYHGNGGRRHFPFTYAHYARIERGGKLPRPRWLAPILAALRLAPGHAGLRLLMESYLRCLLDGEEAYQAVMSAIAPPRMKSAPELGRAAMHWIKTHHSVHLTPEQFDAISSDETAYWCSEALLNDRRSWSAAEIVQALGLAPRRGRSYAAGKGGIGRPRQGRALPRPLGRQDLHLPGASLRDGERPCPHTRLLGEDARGARGGRNLGSRRARPRRKNIDAALRARALGKTRRRQRFHDRPAR